MGATEQKFKVGDWVVCANDTEGQFTAGNYYKVRYVNDYSLGVVADDDGQENGWCIDFFKPWQPKVGDRVQYRDNCVSGAGIVAAPVETSFKSDDGDSFDWYVEVESKDSDFAYYLGEKARMFKTSVLQPLPVAEQPAALLTIEAGKFYKTRDGRKVGPMEDVGTGANTDRWLGFFDGDRKSYWHDTGENWKHEVSPADLIAEWVDEPALPSATKASNDNAAPAKFKVGDLVRCIDKGGAPYDFIVGETYTVSGVHGDLVLCTNGSGMYAYRFELATSNQPTAIVALIENGQPKPAPQPYVHASEAAAAKEAARLAGIHKGQQFGVYVLTTTSKEAAPTYKHEWQRLAAKGEKIAAIKELRSITGLGLKATKDAVEHWVTNDEPYSRIAA